MQYFQKKKTPLIKNPYMTQATGQVSLVTNKQSLNSTVQAFKVKGAFQKTTFKYGRFYLGHRIS
jgi:threonine dehydratase